ncbi:Gcd10p family-domain-containing protein [Lentinula lateritia]|uniref:Gcd10p family-domain-containing protein n=1 Tax=Lentinula aff. lateritia TaxID=2804960 RepID=A0ACC1U5M5_9AGAR|nr:Gcd10p family-domain-containing protein [Lentinula aff. lateritia]KAJ3855256.1 Gcd10p family-domain-containing protein [Lentinula lateritia]
MSISSTSTSSTVANAEQKLPKIQPGHNVLVRQPNGDVRSIKVDRDSIVTVGRLGSFYANELIGQPYGFSYEMVNKQLKILPVRTLEEVEDTDATNELINDGEFVQPLTLDEIQTLKQSGVHASEIIKRQIEQHVNYSLKTEYSKDKYKKRKEAKYSKSFITIEPTMHNVCDYWFNKDQNRIRDIRSDTLSQMLAMANIQPGGRYLAVDDASGLVAAAILERMGGSGTLLTVCDTDSPPAYPVVANMNFPTDMVQSVLKSLNWATSEQDYICVHAPVEVPADEIRSDRQKTRLRKRKVAHELLENTREELFGGEFEALLVASQYEPSGIIDRLVPYLAGSASIVVHSPHSQPLVDLQNKLRNAPGFLGPSLTEGWLRKYQAKKHLARVLPGRTHPTMNSSGSGGYILHVIKVCVCL